MDLLTRGHDSEWSPETAEQLRAHPVDIVDVEVAGVNNGDDGWLECLEFEDGTVCQYTGGFAMYGSSYNTELAEQLGCELNADGTIVVDEHGHTSVDGVYAVGDIAPGHNQIPVAMGEGTNAGIAIHTKLREFPQSLEEIAARGESGEMTVPAISDALREAKPRRADEND